MYTPEQKVATIISLIGDSESGALLKGLPKHLLKRVIEGLSQLQAIDKETVNEFVREFVSIYEKTTSNRLHHELDQNESIQKLVTLAANTIKDQTLEEDAQSSFLLKNVVDNLREINPQHLARWIERERTTTAATILCLIPAPKGTLVFKALNTELQIALCQTIATLEAINTENLQLILAEIENIKTRDTGTLKIFGGAETVSKLLENVDSDFREHIISELRQRTPKLAEDIEQQLLSVEKISTLLPRDLERTCCKLSDRDIVLALKIENKTVQEKFFSCVSGARRETLTELLRSLGPTRKTDVNAAQKKIKDIVTQLHTQGPILFPWEEKLV